jgi:hypothetical protein
MSRYLKEQLFSHQLQEDNIKSMFLLISPLGRSLLFHRHFQYSLSELPTTVTDDKLMANAAKAGGTGAKRAKGTMTRL